MALTDLQEQGLLQLLAENTALLSLAAIEQNIKSSLGATSIPLELLPPTSTANQNDLMLIKQNDVDSSITAGALKKVVNSGLLVSINNLDDVSDVPTSRNNLDVYSKEEVDALIATVEVIDIGSVAMFPSKAISVNYLPLIGLVYSRDDYPLLYSFAEKSGNIISDADWPTNPGSFSYGDGQTNFRLPDVRGVHIRALDLGRGIDAARTIGSLQESQNLSHKHGTIENPHEHGTAELPHEHGTTENPHEHGTAELPHEHGTTELPHEHSPAVDLSGANKNYLGTGTKEFSGSGSTDVGNGGEAFPTAEASTGLTINPATTGLTINPATTGLTINPAKTGLTINPATTGITISADGGDEARPTNIAFLFCIRAK